MSSLTPTVVGPQRAVNERRSGQKKRLMDEDRTHAAIVFAAAEQGRDHVTLG